MYAAVDDPYCYPATTVLKNIPGLRQPEALALYETAITAQRGEESLPAGRLSLTHYRAIHRHLFQDVFAWAGQFRTVRISKGGSMFCYPENIAGQMRALFAGLRREDVLRGRDAAAFAAGAAAFLATLNAIHPFRDGNGRTQLAFMALLCEQAGHPLKLERIDPPAFLAAIIASFDGDEKPLAVTIQDWTG